MSEKGPASNIVECTYIGRAVSGRCRSVEVDWDRLKQYWTEKYGESYVSPEDVLERESDAVKKLLSERLGAVVVSAEPNRIWLGADRLPEPAEATRELAESLEDASRRLL